MLQGSTRITHINSADSIGRVCIYFLKRLCLVEQHFIRMQMLFFPLLPLLGLSWAATIHVPINDCTLSKTPSSTNIAKRGLFDCAVGGMDLPPEEERLFRKFFLPQDYPFFKIYSEDYYESRYVAPRPVALINGDLTLKLEVLKVVLRALDKLGRTIKNIDYLSVSPERRTKQNDTINAAKYILTMWTRLLRNLRPEDEDAYKGCFLKSDVPFKSYQHFTDKMDALRSKLSMIETAIKA
ncbi:hypothetical protein METSCH_E06260 [Metschnikowia aff. pulcherrima]|uniref:Uncharacterized protein n=1 Tax=Metschnikowia aff. pulcherrima TaxID=2163413 RepID=A0A4P6XS41_9ASCO|nr:hypothetical protein METSCH_E06260 [Metschnikowia aff. pulcherrima]